MSETGNEEHRVPQLTFKPRSLGVGGGDAAPTGLGAVPSG